MKIVVMNPINYRIINDAKLSAKFVTLTDNMVSVLYPELISDNYDNAIETLVANSVTISKNSMKIPAEHLYIYNL